MNRNQINIETLPEQLRQVSDEDLVCQLHLATRGESRMTIRVLHHLNEMERRSLHLDLGYGSLFDYCVRKLQYSASAAGRRIQATRGIRGFPELLGMLQARELSLSTVAMIEPILTRDNFTSIIERVRGKSYRQIERVVAQYRPPIAFRDRVGAVEVAVPAVEADAALFDRYCARVTSGGATVATEQKLFIQFLADDELMDLFEEVRTLLTRDGRDMSFADVIKAALAEYRERHSPIARQQRRASRKRETSPDSRRRECGTTGERSRYIAVEARDEVFARDEGRCSYVARDGTRCGSRHGLQVDHIQPFAAGGTNDVSNLRLLCAAHNRRVAEKSLGAHMMERYWPRE